MTILQQITCFVGSLGMTTNGKLRLNPIVILRNEITQALVGKLPYVHTSDAFPA